MSSVSIRNFLLCVYYTVYQCKLLPSVQGLQVYTSSWAQSFWCSPFFLMKWHLFDLCLPSDWWCWAYFHVCSCSYMFLLFPCLLWAGVHFYCPFSVRLVLQLSFWSSLHILCFSLSLDVWFTDAFLLVDWWSFHCFLCHAEAYPFAVTLLVCLSSFLVLWVMSHSLSTILMFWNIPLLVMADVTVKNLIHSELLLTSEAGVHGIQCIQRHL